MKRALNHLVLAAALLAPIAAQADTFASTIKVGKVRVMPVTEARGTFRLTQAGDAPFEGCTVEASYIFARLLHNVSPASLDLYWQLVIEAKRSNTDLKVQYFNEPGGRCILRGVELQ